MRPICLMLALAVVPAAAAAAARERQTAGPLSTVTGAGADVVYAAEYRRGCHEVRLWNVDSRADRRLASHCFVGTSTGSGVSGAIASEGRALWLTYTGGNIREWSLWTKSVTAKARRIAFVTADVDGPAPVVIGRPWERMLPYASGRTIVSLAPNGSRTMTLVAEDRVVAVSAHTGGWAAVLANGAVLAIRPGPVVTRHAFAPGAVTDAILTSAHGLIAKTGDGLEIRSGTDIRRVALPRGSRFLGYAEGLFAYATGAELRIRGLQSGRDRLVRRLAPRFHAQLGRRGLAYGSGRTLGFRAWVTL